MRAGINVTTNHPRIGGGASTFSVKQLGVLVAEVKIAKRCNLHEYIKTLTRGKVIKSLTEQLAEYGLTLKDIDV